MGKSLATGRENKIIESRYLRGVSYIHTFWGLKWMLFAPSIYPQILVK